MISTREAFLDQILARPDDDTPRLIFADWLEEHGDPRGEFIRLQCQLARDEGADDAVAKRVAELLRQHQDEWLQDVKPSLRSGLRFERGFVAGWSVWMVEMPVHSDAIFRTAPLLRWVELHQHMASSVAVMVAEQIANTPLLQNLEELRLDGAFTSAAEAAILSSAYLDKLQSLVIHDGNSLDTRLLVRDGSFSRLQSLDIRGCNIRDQGAQNIAGARCFPSLESLRLSGNNLTASGVRAIVRAHRLDRVSALDLSNNNTGDDGALAIAATAASSRFRWLSLAHTGITDISAGPMAHAGPLSQLEHLDLRGNPAITQSIREQLRSRYGDRLLL